MRNRWERERGKYKNRQVKIDTCNRLKKKSFEVGC